MNKALAPNRSDEAFDVRVLPGAAAIVKPSFSAQLGNEAPSRDYLQNDESVVIELTPRYGTANTPIVPSVFVSVS